MVSFAKQKTPRAPSHLAKETRRWWNKVAADYELEAHHLRLLTLAAEAWDRYTEAREAIAKDGAFIAGRYGTRAHPALKIENDSRIAFARLLRELALDADDPEAPRPPRTADY